MNIFGSLTSAYIVDNAEMKLEACGEYGFVERYGVDENDGVAMVEEIYERLVERQAIASPKTAALRPGASCSLTSRCCCWS